MVFCVNTNTSGLQKNQRIIEIEDGYIVCWNTINNNISGQKLDKNFKKNR